MRNVPDATAVRSRRAVSLRPFSFFLVVPVLFWLKNEKKWTIFPLEHSRFDSSSLPATVVAIDRLVLPGFLPSFHRAQSEGAGFLSASLSLPCPWPSFTGFYLVLPGFTLYFWVLLGFDLV